MNKIKRTQCYAAEPAHFEVAPCDCGNKECQWSEFQDMIWCEKCQKDFTPTSWGTLDGPVPVEAAHLLGFCFDMVDLTDGSYLEFRKTEGKWDWVKLTDEEFRQRVKGAKVKNIPVGEESR